MKGIINSDDLNCCKFSDFVIFKGDIVVYEVPPYASDKTEWKLVHECDGAMVYRQRRGIKNLYVIKKHEQDDSNKDGKDVGSIETEAKQERKGGGGKRAETDED